MDNIIKKLGFQRHYWCGILTPPLVIFGYWSIENSDTVHFFANSIEEYMFGGHLPGQLVLFFLVILIGVIVPVIILSKIKCPQCKTRLVLQALNHSLGNTEEPSPYSSLVCPICGFDPAAPNSRDTTLDD